MSRFSGKCDVADFIEGLAGWYDKNGNAVEFNDQDYHGPLYGNEMKDFEEFKKKTNGTLYQYKLVKLSSLNADFLASKSKFFKVVEHKEEVVDKRLKSGKREKVSYTYEYFGKEYTLKEFNKKFDGVEITTEIHFDTLLDLIPYYPYLVSSCCSSEDKITMYISDKSYVDAYYEEALEHGYESSMRDYYKKALVEHMRDIAIKYYNTEKN